MAKKTYAERIEALKTKRARLQEEERALTARKIVAERKERDRRIFKIGTAIEDTVGHDVTPELLEHLCVIIRRELTTTDDTWGIEELNYTNSAPVESSERFHFD